MDVQLKVDVSDGLSEIDLVTDSPASSDHVWVSSGHNLLCEKGKRQLHRLGLSTLAPL